MRYSRLENLIQDLSTKNKQLVFNEFLDDFYKKPKNIFKDEPDWNDLTNKEISFYVASFHRLCDLYNFPIPSWMSQNKFRLTTPYFALDAKGMLRLTLLCQSPKEYRIRNIWMPKDVLMRV